MIKLSYQALWDNLHESQKLDLETIFKNLNYTPDIEEIISKFERNQHFFNCCVAEAEFTTGISIECSYLLDDFVYEDKFSNFNLEKLPGKTSFILRANVRGTKISIYTIIETYNQIKEELDRFKHLFCFNTCINQLIKENPTKAGKMNCNVKHMVFYKEREKVMKEYRTLLGNEGYVFNSKLFEKALKVSI